MLHSIPHILYFFFVAIMFGIFTNFLTTGHSLLSFMILLSILFSFPYHHFWSVWDDLNAFINSLRFKRLNLRNNPFKAESSIKMNLSSLSKTKTFIWAGVIVSIVYVSTYLFYFGLPDWMLRILMSDAPKSRPSLTSRAAPYTFKARIICRTRTRANSCFFINNLPFSCNIEFKNL